MINPLALTFRGFSVRPDGTDEFILDSGVKYKGVWLEGSLIKLYEKDQPDYYIHNGLPQKHSGYRYIPVENKVIPESVVVLK